MVSINISGNIEGKGNVSNYAGVLGRNSDSFDPNAFQTQLEELLTSSGKSYFTEKEVFAAIAQQEISSNPEALKVFQDRFDEAMRHYGKTKRNAFLFAANRAIRTTRMAGYISLEQAVEIRARAMGAAQLDQNRYLLGDKNNDYDPRFDLETVLATATARMSNYSEGTEVALTRRECRAEMKKLKYGNETSNGSNGSKLPENKIPTFTYCMKDDEINELVEKYSTDGEVSPEDVDLVGEFTSSTIYPSLSSYMMALALMGDDEGSVKETESK